MPTEENKTTTNPANGNGSSQSNRGFANQNTTGENQGMDNLDINLNLEGLDLPFGNESYVDNKTQSTLNQLEPIDMEIEQDNISSNSNPDHDWLLEEDKKVAALLPQEQIIKEDKLDENILNDDGFSPIEPLLALDIPFVSAADIPQEEVSSNELEKLDEGNQKIDDLSYLFDEENKMKEEIVDVESVTANNNISDDQNDNKELYDMTKNIEEPVVEKIESNLISDTGEVLATNTGYVPNESDFKQVQNILNSDQKGEIDVGSLQPLPPIPTNVDLGNFVENRPNNVSNNLMNIDSLISAPANNISIEDMMKLNQTNQFVPENNNQNNGLNNNVSVGTGNIVENNAVNNNNMMNNGMGMNTNTPYNNGNAVQNVPTGVQVGASSSLLKKKKSYSGIKIFALIVLLVAGGFMILSKMYPEEIKEIMNAIKNGNEASIEYSDGSDMLVDEEIVEDVVEPEEEIDPNSLAGQLEQDPVLEQTSGDIENPPIIDQPLDHGSADFNAFEELENVLNETEATNGNTELLEKLRGYSAKGSEFNDWGVANNNTTAIKYGLYITNYAEQFIKDIESNAEIDKSKIDEYILRFENYIQKLNGVRDSLGANSAKSILEGAILNNGTEPTENQPITE